MIGTIYNEVIYRPLLNTLVFLYQTVAAHDLGMAIIFLTILVRLLLFPLFQKSMAHSTKLQAIQPKLKKIQAEHKGNKEKEVEATMALFREHGTNPFAAFGLTLLQLPVLIALYQLFSTGLSEGYTTGLYAFITPPGEIPRTLFGLINLNEANTILVGLTAILQYIQGRMALPRQAPGTTLSNEQKTSRIMLFAAPVIVGIILVRFPAALALYWGVSTLWSVGQQAYINRMLRHGMA